MFYGYHITINRKTSDTDAAYKIFFIILELISDYQLSSLFQIIILLKKSTRRGAFFHVFFRNVSHDKFHFAFMSAVSGTGFQLEKEYGERVMRVPKKTVGKGSMEAGERDNEEASEGAKVPEKKTFGAAADPEQDFWNDVASGEWIFGRGAADMKGGLAAGKQTIHRRPST